MLMDYSWQAASNASTQKLQEELALIKTKFEVQTKTQVENKELKE